MNPHGRLVGRDAALGIAGAALADALAGTGAVLLVTGEPGIGKSALLAEVSRDATSRGARVLRGVGWNGAGTPPYWLWTQVLRGIGPGWNPPGSARHVGCWLGPARARPNRRRRRRTPSSGCSTRSRPRCAGWPAKHRW